MKKLLLSALVLSAGVASAQWTEQATGFEPIDRGINQIDIIDANTVWGLAYDGSTQNAPDIQEFTRTTDGGDNWLPGFIDTAGAPINVLDAVSADEAWVSTINSTAGDKGHLFHTTDGGELWNEANPSAATLSVPQAVAPYNYTLSFQNGVYFFDANNGIVYGDPVQVSGQLDFEIYWTADGGAHWTRVTPASLTPNAQSDEYGYNGGNVGSGNLFWMVTSVGAIWRSADMGHTWNRVMSPIADFGGIEDPNSNGRLHMSDLNGTLDGAVGVLIATADGGDSYTRYTTTDGGATWSAGDPYEFGYFNMDFIPGTSMLVATGDNGEAYTTAYSTDLGASWTEISADMNQKTAIKFLNGSTGWAGGFSQDATSGGIWKYTGEALGVASVANRAQFTATPNPTGGMLQVAHEGANITDVVVYDLLGKQVYNGKFNALNQVDLDLTPLTAGAYILTATADNGAQQTIKIMKN